ncbi:MAG: glutathione S-transferase [Enterobacter kobei]|nr:glutathione S-transferase [Enterobacter kobei]
MVPVLIDDDFVLWESNSICRYLVRKAGRDDLLPGEPRACAEVEHWMDWQATEFNFTLADVVLGLSVNRWKMTPFAKPAVPAIEAWFARLNERPAFLRHGNNGML